MDKCLIHYFSGTGNTYHMVKTIASQLVKGGYRVDLLNVEENKNMDLIDCDLHLFCYPVYGFGTPSIMLRHISCLKPTTGCKAAIICTSAGMEGQSISHFKHLLNKMGFKVILTDMIVYTYNWTQILNPQSKEIEQKVFKKATEKVIEVTQKIIKNEAYFKKRNILTLALSWIIFTLYSKIARRVLGKTFIADDSCIKCSKCKNICPVRAIDMYNGRPRWNWSCEGCQRCINMCPKQSIQLSVIKLVIILASELIPIYIVAYANKHTIVLPMILNFILYLIMFILDMILSILFLDRLERLIIFRKIFQISYTKRYRRNVAEGFEKSVEEGNYINF